MGNQTTTPRGNAGAAGSTDDVKDDAAKAELELIAEIPEADREALAVLTPEQRVDLVAYAAAVQATTTVTAEPEAADEDAAPEVARVSIPGQPGHPPVPNEGNPSIATN